MYVLLPYGFTLFSNNHRNDLRPERFYYLMDLHYSQTPCLRRSMCRCFTTLWIYTILKPRGSREFVTLVLLPYGFTLFSNGVSLHYIKYIVLLPYGFTLFSNSVSQIAKSFGVLLPYGFTLFSNYRQVCFQHSRVLLPYGFTLFSNIPHILDQLSTFYYLMDLHYSQTQPFR